MLRSTKPQQSQGLSRTSQWSRRPIASAPMSLQLLGAAHRQRSATVVADLAGAVEGMRPLYFLTRRVVTMITESEEKAHAQVSMYNTEGAGTLATKRQEALLNRASRRLRTWKYAFNLWGAAYYITGIIGIAASAMAAASLWHPTTSIVATICFGAVGFANPQKKHRAFSNAWRVLDIAIARYE